MFLFISLILQLTSKGAKKIKKNVKIQFSNILIFLTIKANASLSKDIFVILLFISVLRIFGAKIIERFEIFIRVLSAYSENL